jgi:hypothetical protein
MTDIHEVCSLSEDELATRRKALDRGLLAKVRNRRSLADGVLLRFAATPALRAELDEFIAFEQGCCPTLDLLVRETGNELELEIHGLDPDSELFEGLESRSDGGARPASRWRRALSAIGLGSVGALTLCCVVPMAGMALFGSALAAPLTSLDDPWVVSSTALVLAATVWIWQRRRRSRGNATAPACATDGSCGC